MRQMFRQPAMALLHRLGYEVRKKAPVHLDDPFDTQRRLLSGTKVDDLTIFDVGASNGETAAAYRTTFPGATVYCFEPFPDSVAGLQTRFAQDQKVRVVPKAVSNKVGTADLYVNEFAPANSLLPRPASGRRYYSRHAAPKATIQVQVTTLDAFMQANKMERVDILKLDVQGGELMALKGAEHLLRDGTTMIIYSEVMFVPHYEGGPLFHELWSFVAQFGYSIFDLHNLRRGTNGQLRYGDAIFISESLRKGIVDKSPDEP